MCKVMQLYGMAANEALKLSDSQVTMMLEHAEVTANSLLGANSQFQQALGQKLAPVKRVVRAMADEAPSTGSTTTGSTGSTGSGSSGGGPVGPPPSF